MGLQAFAARQLGGNGAKHLDDKLRHTGGILGGVCVHDLNILAKAWQGIQSGASH